MLWTSLPMFYGVVVLATLLRWRVLEIDDNFPAAAERRRGWKVTTLVRGRGAKLTCRNEDVK